VTASQLSSEITAPLGLRPGDQFPSIRLPDHTGREVDVLELGRGKPLVACFVRGWWCPKEQLRLRGLVEMQEEIQREYGGLAVITVDPPYANGALRAGLGASFAFLSDEDRSIAGELGLLELTDETHRPFLPFTFVLDSRRRIEACWCGFWYWGNPTPDELRLTLRRITCREQPTFDPIAVWNERGSAAPDAGIQGDRVLVKEDSKGHELARAAFAGQTPAVGDEVARSEVDGRAWVVSELEETEGTTAIHVRKDGEARPGALPQHHITVPPWIR
jgi:peroxiredoxin